MKPHVLLVALVALLVSACQVDTAIDVEVTEDGSGTVVVTTAFDEEVVAAAPELIDGLRTEDLAAAGWALQGPREAESGGSFVTTATKAFSAPEHLAGILDEIVGPSGLFSDFDVLRERSFARTTYTVTGEIDPAIDIALLSDDEITGLLGFPLGRPITEIEALAGRPLEETMTLTFSVTLPDTVEASSGLTDGRTATWSMAPTDPLPTGIRVSASVENQTPRIWAAIALVALALLGTLIVFRVLARLGGTRSDHVNGEDEITMRRPERPGSRPAATGEDPVRPSRLELVVLDARGVLYDEANDIGARLLPFVRVRGSKATLQEINDVTREAALGRLSTGELWTRLGVEGDPAHLDEAYTNEFKLRPGVLEFIDRLHERGLRVAVITNNVLGWSKALRRRFDLDSRVDTWVISGEIGARKPDAAFFEALRRMTGVDYADSLLIDDQGEDLDMARSLGMATAMFVPPSSQLPASAPHPIVHGFDSFFGRKGE